MNKLTITLLTGLFSAPAFCANEIDYIEQFALSSDRSTALQPLIPGTDDYYYFHLLHYQNTGATEKYNEMLGLWKKRNNGNTPSRARELINRQALIDYPKNAKGSLDHIIRELNLRFNHERKIEGKKSTLPSKLDPEILATQNLVKNGLSEKRHLNRLTDAGLPLVAKADLTPDQRRNLISRLKRPDYPGLARQIIADLAHANSKGFGSMHIHRQLTREQLDALLEAVPKLRNEKNFIDTYLLRLAPSADVDLARDTVEHQAHLDRVWDYVSKLDAVHNSLKALTLYRRLELDRNEGNYNQKRFMEYLKLPRNVHYANPDWLKNPQNKNYHVNLGMQHQFLGRIGNEEPLVTEYLQIFLKDAKNYDAFRPYLREAFLKQIFARTKIEHGIGHVEKWASMLSPIQYKELKERTDLKLAPQNKVYHGAADDVRVDIDIKNVSTLLVKVFEINTFNYYRDQQREIDLAINLDGLVASSEDRYQYAEAPERVVRRSFTFPELKKRGVYVVEFIGNGQSSRALINKGRLHYVIKNTAAGHQFTILNNANKKIDDASVWLGNRKFSADEDGTILIPYSTNPKQENLILREGDFSSFSNFEHEAESYTLNAGLYVDRETLIKDNNATVLVKPTLQVNGAPTSITLLENVELTIETIDLKGIKTQKTISDLKLFEDRETEYTFKVPDELATIRFALSGKVANLSRNQKQTLTQSASYQLNGIDKTAAIDGFHITRPKGNHFLELTGKTGEVRQSKVVHFEFKHRFYAQTISRSLQTDEKGRCELGPLTDIEWVKIKSHDGHQHVWRPQTSRFTFPSELHGHVGTPIQLPLWLDMENPLSDCSLLEVRQNAFIKDCNSALTWKSGLLTIDDLPAGDYSLRIASINRTIPIRIAEGLHTQGYAISTSRKLEVRPGLPIYYRGSTINEQGVTISIGNATKFTRVHVFATRYEPEYRAFDQLGYIGYPSALTMQRTDPVSFYVSGRNIGDEYRYILDRKLAKKYPGNMLERPGLLLNPWAVRDTDSSDEKLEAMADYAAASERAALRGARSMAAKRAGGQAGNYPNIDFLKTSGIALLNLEPNADGIIRIPINELAEKTQLNVVIVSPRSTQTIQLPLPDKALENRDLRLIASLDSEKHYTEQKLVSIAGKGKPFVIADVTTSTYEPYDSLAKAYQLLTTLSNNATLQEFAFILQWPALKPEEKKTKYSKYASHELNFFLYHKDRPFFDQVIANYLKNKKDKTFMDHWLLGSALTGYLEPWAFSRLNIVERILLGKRIADQHPALERHVRELNELIPADVTRENVWFNTASARSGLETKQSDFRTFAAEASMDKIMNATMEAEGIAGFSGGGGAADEAKSKKLMEQSLKGRAQLGMLKKLQKSDKELFFKSANRADANGRRFYQKLDATKEWAENNYYQLPIQEQLADLIAVNDFWADYAQHQGKAPFLSVKLPAASRNFAEMMLALAVLDLPFEPAEHKSSGKGQRYEVIPGSDMLVFHKEIRESTLAEDRPPILVSQNFFRNDDRYRYDGNEKYDKYVTEEFLPHVVYGCQVILTNPTSNTQKLSALLQIPRGAIPVSNGFRTKGHQLQLNAYTTQTIEYFFYFPATGTYPHYPVHVAKDQALIAHTNPMTCKVVEKLSKIDKTSWAWIAQNGSMKELLKFLNEQNIERLDLDDIAWRMQQKEGFLKISKLLEKRHKYHHTLWMYALKHNETEAAAEYLQHSPFAERCGLFIDTELLSLNPIARHNYQHLEYAPLVNARAHRVGKKNTILNHRLRNQYHHLLRYLSYKAELDAADRLAVTYYLGLQDRIEEALTWFASVKENELSSKIQYEYMKAYLGMYEAKLDQTREIATRHAKHPVPRWRNKFQNILNQLDGANQVANPEDRDQSQEQLAGTEPALEFSVEARQVHFKYQNLRSCTLNFYPMDIELLFSRNPFIKDQSAQFSFIKPVLSRTVQLPADQDTFTYELPKQFHSANVMVEAVTAGLTRSEAYYANALNLQIVENYGQLRVTHLESGDPLDTVYVKVYARMADGSVKFFKDGYTDFRGRFDYVSLNSDNINEAQRFSLLIMSDQHGAVIREVAPPKR